MKKIILLLTTITFLISCSKEPHYKYVYKVCINTPLVNTKITSFYVYEKGENCHTTAWIKADYLSKNEDKIAYWQPDSLWVDSLGFIEWRVK